MTDIEFQIVGAAKANERRPFAEQKSGSVRLGDVPSVEEMLNEVQGCSSFMHRGCCVDLYLKNFRNFFVKDSSAFCLLFFRVG